MARGAPGYRIAPAVLPRYCFFFSTVVVFFVVVVWSGGVVPSGFIGDGVVFFVSLSVVVVCSVGAGGVWITVAGGVGACWQPASIKLSNAVERTMVFCLLKKLIRSSPFAR